MLAHDWLAGRLQQKELDRHIGIAVDLAYVRGLPGRDCTHFAAIVDRATGRRVSSFISSMNLEPLYAVELFRLDPAA